jgi:hypothetical protein
MNDHRVGSGGDYLATLDEFYAAELRYVAAGGIDAGASFAEMAAFLHPDVVLRQGPTVPYPGDWVGADGVERFFGVFSQTWNSLELHDARYFVGVDGVAINHRMTATSRMTGRSVDVPIGQLILFDDDLIRDFTVFYFDPVAIAKATCS